MRSPFFATLPLPLITSTGRWGTVNLELLVSVNSKMVNAVDQSTYPYTPDPSFVPFQMNALVVFDDQLLATELNQDGASITIINFGPGLTLYSPLTNSLRYSPKALLGTQPFRVLITPHTTGLGTEAHLSTSANPPVRTFRQLI